MPEPLSILYIGSLNIQSNSYRRFLALKSISNGITAIDTDPFILAKFIAGFQHHYNWGPGIYLLNKAVRKAVKNTGCEIVLVDNKTYLTARTLQYIKQYQSSAKIANLLTDDPFGLYGKSWSLLKKTASLYDIIFVQRKVNIEEFKLIGAKKIEICCRSFDPSFNRPLQLSAADVQKYAAEVGFAGTYETFRASFIAYLIQNNIAVAVTGDGWPEKDYWDIIKPYYKGPSVYGEEYIKTINGMGVALHFLRHANRDEQDSRTFEIPACKVFMLAEHSDLQQQLFKTNEEVVFFKTKEELLKKVNYYMVNEAERIRIALNGYNRCFMSGYDHQSRMKYVLETISNMSHEA